MVLVVVAVHTYWSITVYRILLEAITVGTSVRRSRGRRSGVAVRAVDCWQ